jgi:molecular chaperone GrpE
MPEKNEKAPDHLEPKIVAEPEQVQAEQEAKPDVNAELLETKDRLLRIAADFDNYKKTAQREQLNSIKFANEGLLTNLLPIIDNLEQAVLASKSSEKNDVVLGIELVLKQFNELLEKSGVEVFSAMGKMFDPSRHEALGQKEDDSVPEGQVILEYQKGYLLNQRLLRPARVIVAKGISGN